MSGPVDVLAEIDALIVIRASRAAKNGAPLTAIGDLQRAEATRIAVAKLIEANRRTIEAFEELGRASGVASNHFARRECEAAMVAQKAALTCFGTAK